MIKLEFGDAMRRLRDGETLIANRPRGGNVAVIWDARGLWVYTEATEWEVSKEPLSLMATSAWYLESNRKHRNLLPMGPAPER
jgi:hypothetical protein